MYKLVIFDLDDTLAEIGKAILPENLSLLKEIEENGFTVAICSGKPIYYLCGFMRQVGLKSPILVGENGSVLQIGVDLPPKNFTIMKYSNEARASLVFLREKILQLLPNIWFQPNQVGLTPFPKNDGEFEIIEKCIRDNKDKLSDISIYRHIDSIDITPSNLSKKTGLEYLGKLINISREETIAIGDGVNDYPMFEYAGLSLGINVIQESAVDKNFSCINDALRYVLEKFK